MTDAAPTWPHRTPSNLLVLHALRCIGVAELGRVADAAGLEEADAESELIDLGAAGLAVYRAGVFAGWGITDAGRVSDGERIAEELGASGARETVAQAYTEFLPLNTELLEVCTAWQTRTVDGRMAMNDHTDGAHDAAVLRRLSDLDRRVDTPLAALAAALLRFGRYRVRLTDARSRVQAGDVASVADRTDSYHAVWFQLHEDLLVTLGIPRHGT